MAGVEVALFLFLFFLTNSIISEQEIPCNGTSNGTHCLPNEIGTCTGYEENPLTLADKNYLLSVHTSIRENLTEEVNGRLPRAFFMKKLAWSEDLEKMAQTWAESCSATKQPRLLFQNQPVGQLVLTMDQNIGKDLTQFVQKWTAGLKFLNGEIIGKYHKPISADSDYEPAAQMIWWNTNQVGCGRSSYTLKNCDENVQNCAVVELVCNYFPAGIREGEPVYITENDNKLICQYDNESKDCKNLQRKNEEEQQPESTTKKKDLLRDRIRKKILELWPAASRASLAWKKWDVRCFYALLLFTTFNVYEKLLRN